jgi:putative Flp pilus-assembly TadE/G-like protein
MLVQVALIAVAMFGLISLVVDMGYVTLTRVQMQNAVDTAAVEAVRKRNAVGDSFDDDCARRAAVRDLVQWVFDDDLDPANGDPSSFGAGPIVSLSGGDGTALNAYQHIDDVPTVHAYKPLLQLNQTTNALQGDMVSGRFTYTSDPGPSEDSTFAPPGSTAEQAAYARNDFVAASPTSPPCASPPPDPLPGPMIDAANDAFLVRLRRSRETLDTSGDASSNFAPLPLLFGLGTTVHAKDQTSYNPRSQGITVRATAIAQVRPALRVGLPTDAGDQGVTPFPLLDTFVATLNADGSQATLDPASGAICQGLTCTGAADPSLVGWFVDDLTDPSRARWMLVGTVGADPLAPVPVVCATANAIGGYGPVYSLMSSGDRRIVGFARLALAPDPARATDPCALVISHGISLVANSNATALLTDGLSLPPAATPADVKELLDKNRVRPNPPAYDAPDYGPVLAPVLAR